MLKPKVRVLVDGLPFTTNSYKRAKNLLKSKYVKDVEVANALIQSLISFPTITITHVQALDTIGKLEKTKVFVKLILDKLASMKSDLVRADYIWHDWDFEELKKELSKWVDCNSVKSEPKHD